MLQRIELNSGHLKRLFGSRMTKIIRLSTSLPDTAAIADTSGNDRSWQVTLAVRSKALRTFKVLLPTLFFSIIAPPLNAAPPRKGITESEGFWTQAVAEGNLSNVDDHLSTTRLWLETQGRFNNANPMENMNFYQGMLRTAIGYALTDRLTLWAGYTYLPTENYGQGYVGEQDAWPAIRYIFPTRLGTITLREMVEMRFVRGDAPGIRPRTLIKLIHPFEFEPRLGLVLWDEFFFNVNNVANNPSGGFSGFNQNRAFAGLSWIFNENTRFEFGYMNLMANKSKPDLPYSAYTSMNTISASVFMGW